MTKKDAIAQAMNQLPLADSLTIMNEAQRILDSARALKNKADEFNALSAKRVGSLNMRPITTLNQLTLPVIREIQWSTASEFLGFEYWESLPNMQAKLIAAQVYNMIKERMLRGMA
jgi:hypothetical protein